MNVARLYKGYLMNTRPANPGPTVVMVVAVACFLNEAPPLPVQVDWEAILAQRPQQFIDAVSPWMLPAAAKGGAAPSSSSAVPPPDRLPQLVSVLCTMRQRIEALNGPDAPRI